MRNLNSFIKENAQNNVTYVTDFKLAVDVPVKDANEYLQEDDMLDYLKDRVEDDKNTTIKLDDLVSITWAVANDGGYSSYNDHGTITLVTTREFTKKELDFVSDYVKGQNADGLGEGFEQRFEYNSSQDRSGGRFGNYGDTEDDEDDDYCEMASFDWKTNDYKFKKK